MLVDYELQRLYPGGASSSGFGSSQPQQTQGPTTDPEPDPASDEASPGEDFGQHICRGDDCGFLDTVDSFLRWLSFLVVPIVIIVVIVGGIQLSLAGDNPEATKKAKAKITQAIVALVFFILLWGLLKWLI